jgi:hypothetical protein
MKTEVWSVADYRKFIVKGLKKGKLPKKPASMRGQEHLSRIGMALKDSGYTVVFEHIFHPTRKWRFDLALPILKIAVEYEGISSSKSRHTTIKGYTGDTEKYNEAALMGWIVIRKTVLNLSGVHQDILKAIKARESETHKSHKSHG